LRLFLPPMSAPASQQAQAADSSNGSNNKQQPQSQPESSSLGGNAGAADPESAEPVPEKASMWSFGGMSTRFKGFLHKNQDKISQVRPP